MSWAPPPFVRDALLSASGERVDTHHYSHAKGRPRLRAALDSVPLPYQLVYGRGPQRLAHAERALRAHPLIGPLLGQPATEPTTRAARDRSSSSTRTSSARTARRRT